VPGPPCNRLVAALLSEVRRGPPKIPPLPESFQHYRRQLGAQVYGAMGIALEDRAKHAAAVLRNWKFFGAPLVGIVCMHRDLGPADALSVRMYLQTAADLEGTRPAWLVRVGRGLPNSDKRRRRLHTAQVVCTGNVAKAVMLGAGVLPS